MIELRGTPGAAARLGAALLLPLGLRAGSPDPERPVSAATPVVRDSCAPAAGSDSLRWRFPVGEQAVYDVTFGRLKVGKASLSVESVDTLRGTPSYRVAFELNGGTFFYKVDDRQVSWVAPHPMRSLRFEQRLREGDYRRDRRWELHQDSSSFTREDLDSATARFLPTESEQSVPMPADALDEISYLYLARTLPLSVGRTFRFDRYFKEDGNPVILNVLRKETVRVPAGRYDAFVVQPIIQTDGMFGQGGKAEVYIADDPSRAIVKLETSMKVGRMNMYLHEYSPGRPNGLIRCGASGGAASS